ncbi:hypothetical protein Halhy_6101 [Haliscomenobacter hydrossis DSM 1100]|uniref:Uncharacterized protein n=1 Tax=Haliscomenobacter hydrossis (strain ATCC 27775 / DSM 1100 / LMG 10767 / O) TaxID=760192 RepID=F4L2K5_HALH1|nr:hypothetical protein Halhy_6101 [Haliscomenobacter hydrossis DSM 1100]
MFFDIAGALRFFTNMQKMHFLFCLYLKFVTC